jgi:hypothetical protein
MPAKMSLKGKPDELVHIQFKAPLWLKRQALEAAQTLGKSFTDFCKDAIRDASDLGLARARRAEER